MKRLGSTFLILIVAGLHIASHDHHAVKDDMARLIDEQFRFAAAQYKVLAKNVPSDLMPKTYNTRTS